MNKDGLKIFTRLYDIVDKYEEHFSKEDIDEMEILFLLALSVRKIHRKGRGRIIILVDTKCRRITEDDRTTLTNKVKQIIKEVDDFEYEYLPDDYIDINKTDLVYSDKFDIDCEKLIRACYVEGIRIKILSEDRGECPI